jgi:hypothetical protein
LNTFRGLCLEHWLGSNLDPDELEALIARCLQNFYERRINKIKELELRKVLSTKNPYLYRALGTENASEIVEGILSAFISSSDEGIFGDAFFEPIARLVSGGQPSPTEAIDIIIETEGRYLAIAMKSGPNWGNSDQLKKQNEQFMALRSRMFKPHEEFDAAA